MPTAEVVGGPVAASPEEVPQIQNLSTALSGTEEGTDVRYYLADSTGRKLELPPSIFQILVRVVREMATGHSVALLNYDHELTTQQAADILQVSRPFLIRLLEQGHMPYHMVGSHRRIRMRDLMQYKKRRDSRRRELLQEMQRISEGLSLYDGGGTPPET